MVSACLHSTLWVACQEVNMAGLKVMCCCGSWHNCLPHNWELVQPTREKVFGHWGTSSPLEIKLRKKTTNRKQRSFRSGFLRPVVRQNCSGKLTVVVSCKGSGKMILGLLAPGEGPGMSWAPKTPVKVLGTHHASSEIRAQRGALRTFWFNTVAQGYPT